MICHNYTSIPTHMAKKINDTYRGGEQYSKVGGGKSCRVAVSYRVF